MSFNGTTPKFDPINPYTIYTGLVLVFVVFIYYVRTTKIFSGYPKHS